MNEQNQNHIGEPNKKVSSVEWLLSKIELKEVITTDGYIMLKPKLKQSDIIQAKAMHKQEIIESYDEGCQLQYDLNLPTSGKQYYQETFES